MSRIVNKVGRYLPKALVESFTGIYYKITTEHSKQADAYWVRVFKAYPNGEYDKKQKVSDSRIRSREDALLLFDDMVAHIEDYEDGWLGSK